jgi:hypothetical protein
MVEFLPLLAVLAVLAAIWLCARGTVARVRAREVVLAAMCR